MDSSVSPKGEIWFLRVCHHISNAVYFQLVLLMPGMSTEAYCCFCFPFQAESHLHLIPSLYQQGQWHNIKDDTVLIPLTMLVRLKPSRPLFEKGQFWISASRHPIHWLRDFVDFLRRSRYTAAYYLHYLWQASSKPFPVRHLKVTIILWYVKNEILKIS